MSISPSSFYELATQGSWNVIEGLLVQASSDSDAVLSAFRYLSPSGWGGEGENLVHEILSAYEKPGGTFFNHRRGYKPPPPDLLSRVVAMCGAKGYRVLEVRTSSLHNTYLHYAATHTDDLSVHQLLVRLNPKMLILRNEKERRPLDSAIAWGRSKEVCDFLTGETAFAEKIDKDLSYDQFRTAFQMWKAI